MEVHRAFSRMVEGGEGVLVAAFDESGKLADSGVVVFGGFIATPEGWQVIADKWREKLNAKGLKYLTMKEAMRFRGQFQGWERRGAERDDLLRALAEDLQFLVIAGLCAWQTSSSFKALPATQRRTLKNIHYCAFEGCAKQILELAKSNECDFVIHCDDSTEYSKTALSLYHRMKERDAEFKRRCLSITFAEDETYAPIQAADLFAYGKARVLVGKAEPVLTDILSILSRRGTVRSAVQYRPTDRLGDGRLESFNQESRPESSNDPQKPTNETPEENPKE